MMMWRGHQKVQSTVQRWLLRRHHHTLAGGYCLSSASRYLGGTAPFAASEKCLQRPSILSRSDVFDAIANMLSNLSNPLLISCHAFSTRGRNRPRGPDMRGLQSVDEVIVTAHEHLDIMSRKDVSAFWTCISKLMTKRQPKQRSNSSNTGKLSREDMQQKMGTIFNDTTRGIEGCSIRELTETILGMAKIVKILRGGKKRGEDNSRAILREMLLNKDMTPNEVLFRLFAGASIDKLHQFDARCLSNLAYAYALIDYVPKFHDGSDLYDHIEIKAVRKTREFNAQDISNMVWAYATVKKSQSALFAATGDQIVSFKDLTEFKPQALKDVVWAYATAGVQHPKLFNKVADHIAGLDNLVRFIPQHLSNTVWAYATAGILHPILFEKVANYIVGLDNLERFKPQELSNTLWAYATAGINHPKLFEKVANHIVKHEDLDKFKPQALKDTVWAFATAQASHPKLFQKVAKAAIQRNEEFNNSQEVANLLWAFATIGIIDKQLFSSFLPTAAKLIGSYNNQELANIAWAYAVADVDAPTLFNNHFSNRCVQKEDGFENEALSQLHQWHLWQTKEKSHDGLSIELQDKCYEVFISEEPTPSKLQDDVVAQLSSMDLEPKEEVLIDSGCRIDALVEVNGKTIGVEVDGPYHFIGRSRSPTGSTILKRRQVPSIDGIKLVSVPYWEWDELGKDEVKKQEYLQKLFGSTNNDE